MPRIPGFEIQSVLGRGAMGVVYLAIETGLDRLVALKILPGALGAGRSTGAAGAGSARRGRYQASGTPTSCRSMITARPTDGSSWCSNTSPAAPSSSD